MGPRARVTPRPAGRALLLMSAAALTALLLAGCTNAQLINVWSDPGYRGHAIRDVLVVSRESDPAERRIAEDAMVSRLTRDGLRVTASYELFADAAPSRKEMESALDDRHLDVAIILKPLAPTSDTRWVPGWSSVEPRVHYDPWSGNDVVVYRRRVHPGYHYTEHYDRTQVTLWSPESDGRMVWAGTVLVPMSRTDDVPAADIAAGVVPALRKAGLIARR